jgi:hypothetical protein
MPKLHVKTVSHEVHAAKKMSPVPFYALPHLHLPRSAQISDCQTRLTVTCVPQPRLSPDRNLKSTMPLLYSVHPKTKDQGPTVI